MKSKGKKQLKFYYEDGRTFIKECEVNKKNTLKESAMTFMYMLSQVKGPRIVRITDLLEDDAEEEIWVKPSLKRYKVVKGQLRKTRYRPYNNLKAVLAIVHILEGHFMEMWSSGSDRPSLWNHRDDKNRKIRLWPLLNYRKTKKMPKEEVKKARYKFVYKIFNKG
jgi:hypothetical protein